MSQIEIAKAIATIAHRGQVDKAGNPYIDHPRRVAERLSAQGRSEVVVAAGWLHDVLEDTALSRDDLHNAGVHMSVIGYVEQLTRAERQTVEDYYEQVMQSTGARMVKLADIEDNTDPSRLALLEDDATIARLTRKYAKALLLLGAA